MSNSTAVEGRRTLDKTTANGVIGDIVLLEASQVRIEHGAIASSEQLVRGFTGVHRQRLAISVMHLFHHLESDAKLIGEPCVHEVEALPKLNECTDDCGRAHGAALLLV